LKPGDLEIGGTLDHKAGPRRVTEYGRLKGGKDVCIVDEVMDSPIGSALRKENLIDGRLVLSFQNGIVRERGMLVCNDRKDFSGK